MQHATRRQPGILRHRRPADHEFAHGRPESASLDDAELRPHGLPRRPDAAQDGVAFARAVAHWQTDDRDDLAGDGWRARGIACDARQATEGIEIGTRERAADLGVGADPQRDDAIRATMPGQRVP